MSFLVDTEALILTGFTSAASSYGGEVLGVFRPLFVTGFSIWIMLISYEVAFGKTEDGLTYILTKIFRMFLIGTLALWGWPEVANLLSAIKDGFVGGGSFSAQLDAKLINPLALALSNLLEWFASSFEGQGFTDILQVLLNLGAFSALLLVFGITALCVAVIACVSLAMFLTASCVFILLMAIGPFFLLCLAFPFTQKFFEAFIGSVMTAIFGMAFIVLMMKFATTVVDFSTVPALMPDFSSATDVLAKAKLIAFVLCAKIGACLLIIYMYQKIFDLAAALGGGLNMGNNMVGALRTIARDMQKGGAPAGGKAGKDGAPNKIDGGGSPASPTNAARSNNRTLTGMGVSASAAGARATGRGAVVVARAIGTGAVATGRYVSRGSLAIGKAVTSAGKSKPGP